MTEAQAVAAIWLAWKTGWGTLHPSDVPYTFENESYEAVAKWIRVSVGEINAAQSSMGPAGSRRIARSGTIGVQIFTDVNVGRSVLSGLADEVRSVLELARISVAGDTEPICTYAARTTSPTEDGRWFMAVVTVPFRFYQTR